MDTSRDTPAPINAFREDTFRVDAFRGPYAFSECDARFTILPRMPRVGEDLSVAFTDVVGHVYIGLSVEGDGAPTSMLVSIEGSGPFTWRFVVRGFGGGLLRLAFTADMGARTIATCSVWVAPAPPRPDAGPQDAGRDAGPGPHPPTNRFGIGFVGPGDATDIERAANLVGPGGFVQLIFPGIVRETSGPDPSWVAAIRETYARDLIPVVRMGPPWGDRFVRDQADPGSGHRRYTQLAAAYRRVVMGLPLRPGWPLYVEVHNEPNLCYEWQCRRSSVPGGWISGAQMAAEYAAMLRDVAQALHGIGDSRIRVLNGGLAPGGPQRCECEGSGWTPGATTLDFLRDMRSAVPDVFNHIDAFASHSYPARGFGWGFFVPYSEAGVGLRVFESEIAEIGRPDIEVFLTETGWCEPHPDERMRRCTENGGSREQIAVWTEEAYRNFWLVHPRLRAIMPFILRDPAWNEFAWMDPGGAPYPVYTRIRALRCTLIPGRCP
ncbi:MAG: hypothetical protein NZM37_03990 [Sandaracinaceae bacterium]|nr:hypothetical protein [Sandaracinaceae bacterium]